MNHFINKLLLVLLVGLFPFALQAQCTLAGQCTFTSTGTGNWSSATTWTKTCVGAPASPNTVPGINDCVVIQAEHNVTLNSGTTVQVASILLKNSGSDGATLTVVGSATHLIVGPTGGTNVNVLVLEGKNNIILNGALLTVTGALFTTNNGNSIASGTSQGFLSIERCARQGGNDDDIGDTSTGCVNTNFFNGSSLVYCARCTGCGAVGANGIQVESAGGCGIILLPITLIKLDAIYKANEGVSIEWETVNEIDNDYFEIEHSSTGESFKSIGKIAGFGNTTSVKKYSFLDTEFSLGTNYYRLKQVDFDGAFTYTKVVAAVGELLSKQNILVYPNPNDGTALSLQLLNKNEILSLEIFTMIGVIYFSSTHDEKHNLQLKFTTRLPKGIYAVKIRTKEGVSVERFVVE